MNRSADRARDASGAAKGDALRYLTHRARSADEVRMRLSERGHPPDVVESVVAWLQDCRYVDDAKFAENWIESRIRSKPLGRLRLSRELQSKGVADETIDAALDALLPEERERELAFALGTSRMSRYRDVPRDVAARRLGAFLMRRGFPASVVTEVLRALEERADAPAGDGQTD